jgi:hypothetical protein
MENDTETTRTRKPKEETIDEFSTRTSHCEITKETVFTTPNIFKILLGPKYTGSELYFHYKGFIVGLKGKEEEVLADLNKDFNATENKRFGHQWIS